MAAYTDNKIRISIDVALFCAIVFNAGISWNAISELKSTVRLLQQDTQVQADARLLGYKRLARVEEKIDGIGNQLDRLERQIDDSNRQGSAAFQSFRKKIESRGRDE